jgi:hypothetical protein
MGSILHLADGSHAGKERVPDDHLERPLAEVGPA